MIIFSTEEEVSCKDLLTSRDKVEIIKATFAYIAGIDGLWNRLPLMLELLLPPTIEFICPFAVWASFLIYHL